MFVTDKINTQRSQPAVITACFNFDPDNLDDDGGSGGATTLLFVLALLPLLPLLAVGSGIHGGVVVVGDAGSG